VPRAPRRSDLVGAVASKVRRVYELWIDDQGQPGIVFADLETDRVGSQKDKLTFDRFLYIGKVDFKNGSNLAFLSYAVNAETGSVLTQNPIFSPAAGNALGINNLGQIVGQGYFPQ
jgi:uncharacterized protein YqjF (DUF2071 family)